ncbi:DUF1501 domain-containing protein [Tundrisphaera lichenicola]|uniref:DUF1501 domain-containing protein n=1 Tax=Tundrisphaera lichenicola TaxID=2029860 RepID=UPI003EBD4213
MIRIPIGPRSRRCDGVARRDFLRVGGLAAFGLPALLRAEASGNPETAAPARSVILLYLGGGLSHHDSFDPKPDAPSEVKGQYGTIDTRLPGVRFSDKIPLLAARNDRFALVRSGAHGNDHHETATNWVLSGKFGSAFGDYPAMGAVVAHELGYRGPMPPYFAVPKNPSFTWELGKSAFLGGRYESFKSGDPNAPNFAVKDLTVTGDSSTGRVGRRQSLRLTVDDLARQVDSDDGLRTMDEFQRRAMDLVVSPEARRAFDLDREDPRLRDRYGRTTTGQGCLLARRLIEAGVRFVTINSAGWDHHANIFGSLDRRLPEFDAAFSALLDDLQGRGLLESTLVVAMGEFGRTPKLNATAGRDHWGHAASLVFAGANIVPGRVIGRTDDQGAHVIDRPVSPADVASTIYQALGVDPARHLMTPENRPVAILDEGSPISEMLA